MNDSRRPSCSGIIGTIFFILMIAAALSRATGHNELTNQMNDYAHLMATATAQAAASSSSR